MSGTGKEGFCLKWFDATNKAGDRIFKAFTDTGVNFSVEPISKKVSIIGDDWAGYVYDKEGRRVVYIGDSREKAQRACGIYDIFDPARRCAAVRWSEPD